MASCPHHGGFRNRGSPLSEVLLYIVLYKHVQWNPSKIDTIGTKDFVLYSKVSLAQGLVVDRAPPTIMANHDKARLSTIKKTVLIRDLSISSILARIRTYLGNIATACC